MTAEATPHRHNVTIRIDGKGRYYAECILCHLHGCSRDTVTEAYVNRAKDMDAAEDARALERARAQKAKEARA